MAAHPRTRRSRARRGRAQAQMPVSDPDVDESNAGEPAGEGTTLLGEEPAPEVEPARWFGSLDSPVPVGGADDHAAPTKSKHRHRRTRASTPAADSQPAAAPTPPLPPATRAMDDDAWSLVRAVAAARQPVTAWRPDAGQRGIIGATLLAGVAVALVAVTVALVPPESQPAAVAPTESPRATTVVVDGVAASVTFEETFDDLPMDSTLADPWTIDGDGPVRVVALPTSVDRSIRIASDTSGGPTNVCRPIGVEAAKALRIAFDYRLGRALPEDARLLGLRAGATAVAALLLDASTGRLLGVTGSEAAPPTAAGPSAAPAKPPGASNKPARDSAWRRVEISVSESGELTWQANEASGGAAGSGTLASAADASRIDTVCFSSPAGAPAGWVALDDILIEG